VSVLCRFYGVSRCGYYAFASRAVSARTAANEALLASIARIHTESHKTYGSPRIHRQLRREGERVGKSRVERLMRQNGVKGRSATLYHANPGLHAFYLSIPNRQLDRIATGPDQVWVGDITYLKLGNAWRYLATVMDKYSRRIIGWSLSKNKDANLTLSALNRAVHNRRPGPGLVFHSDRGIEFAAFCFRERLQQRGFVQSMNRPGTMTDNAHMESFYHSMKSDVVHGVTFQSDRDIEKTIRGYVPFYNHRRLHSLLGYVTPVEYEQQ
jgi:putative transposase